MDEMRFAKTLARKIGAEIVKNFENSRVLYKKDGSAVTPSDISINQEVIKKILEYYPQDSILGEEGVHLSGNSSRTWVCDPIDGTLAYTIGVPTCVFSLALLDKKGQPILAVVFDPFLKRMYSARKNEGAYVNDTPLQVDSHVSIEESYIGNSGRSSPFINAKQFKTNLYANCYRPIILHSVIYEAMLVASGKISATVMTGDGLHDAACAKLIVEEAGGKVTNLFGYDQSYAKPIKGAIISNGTLLHKKLVKLAVSCPI